ncbi:MULTISPECIES: LysR family transcriptional regulator [unclassified Pseudomonas]|uniref:LysR family transcriptional regulator n=1 Tax=unclassified Pseudomonas TaxID=196821 RepID=UPI00048A1C57|nr:MULTISPECIES: LysR family transcriptional regulator [unclassified Pseudomonas]RAS30646.1 DNA-binding transcriptional LysR family regulator [Pseudomonas sp. URMO17WK12:I7]SMF38704.1 transcriptional regulator, LysR family [Pseudomonas sp. URMO17WK12:I5]
MELVWLEDFIALAENGSFVRAADARHVTQPAFSRRIRSFESWIGVELFTRTPQGANLTEAGKHILPSVLDEVSRIYRIRSEAQELAGKAAKVLQFAATHSLSFTFFPRWIRAAERGAPIEAIRLHSDSMASCEQMLVHGQVQFLLCHRHPEVPPQLPHDQYISKKVGDDILLPLASPALDLESEETSMPYLAYTEESGLGRIVRHRLQGKDEYLQLKPHFSSHLAAVLTSMALEGKGIAWLPKSLTEQEVLDGRLIRALDERWDIPLDINLTRPTAPINTSAETFWSSLNV